METWRFFQSTHIPRLRPIAICAFEVWLVVAQLWVLASMLRNSDEDVQVWGFDREPVVEAMDIQIRVQDRDEHDFQLLLLSHLLIHLLLVMSYLLDPIHRPHLLYRVLTRHLGLMELWWGQNNHFESTSIPKNSLIMIRRVSDLVLKQMFLMRRKLEVVREDLLMRHIVRMLMKELKKDIFIHWPSLYSSIICRWIRRYSSVINVVITLRGETRSWCSLTVTW